MAGYSRLYVVGGLGGFQGADGVNPIDLQILVGEGNRQWLEPHYFDPEIKPMGKVRSIVPAGPDHPDALLDACLAFVPQHFASCRSLPEVMSSLKEAEALDFDLGQKNIPSSWNDLREEARPLFRRLNIWKAELVPLQSGEDA